MQHLLRITARNFVTVETFVITYWSSPVTCPVFCYSSQARSFVDNVRFINPFGADRNAKCVPILLLCVLLCHYYTTMTLLHKSETDTRHSVVLISIDRYTFCVAFDMEILQVKNVPSANYLITG